MATPVDDTVPLIGNPYVDGLTQGGSWVFGSGARVLTYSLSLYDYPAYGGTWTPAWQAAVGNAFQAWADVANISFVQSGSGTVLSQSTADHALALTFELQVIGALSLGLPPSPSVASEFLAEIDETRATYPRPEGDLFFDHTSPLFTSFALGGEGFETVVHEIGHALGLKHPFDDGGSARPTFYQLGIGQYDNNNWTIMSYNDAINNLPSHAASPMVLDILAMQHIYGPNMAYHVGNDTYLMKGGVRYTIWDAGGTDVLDASSILSPATIDLHPGAISHLGFPMAPMYDAVVGIAYGVTVENVVGTLYNDLIYGNDADNTIDGGGYIGSIDTLAGGKGNDTYVLRGGGEAITENPGEGVDTVIAPLSHGLGANIENLELRGAAIFGTGNDLANRILGNGVDNILSGDGGDDYLDGGAGADNMYGGLGDDTIIVDSLGDSTTEYSSQGTDTILTPFTTTLDANFENLTLTGGANVNGTGNTSDNVLTGNAGINVLTGGLGDDTYVIQTPADQVVENAGEGTDTVVAPFTYSLVSTALENLTLAGYAAIDGTGSDADNVLLGNANRNILFGGDGADVLDGAGGNDTLRGDAGSDKLDGGYGFDTAIIVSSRAGATVTRLNGDVVVASADGTDALHDVERAQFTDQSLLLASDAHASGVDFSGDGKADILWRETGDALGLWTMAGTAITGAAVIGNASQYWTLAASGDFNGDAKAEVLWRGDGGEVALWTLNGFQLGSGGVVGTASSYWSIAGTGDFNADGKAEILWRGAGGEVALWILNGFQLGAGNVIGTPSPYWTVAGVGDFNGDRTDDILWRGEGGEAALWTMNGFQPMGQAVIQTISPGWSIAGSVDFNGDGKADILWRGGGGEVALWTMNGFQPMGQAVIQTVSPEWSIAGAGDFNGDRKADILWRSDGASPALWTMDGFQPTSQSVLADPPSYDWLIG